MSDTLQDLDNLKHSPYGPSQAEGWSNCLDYVWANRGLPDLNLKVAAEGTFAHIISDECLLLGADAYDYMGQRIKVSDWTFEWTLDDADLLQPGLDWVREQGGMFFGEHRVDVSAWTIPHQHGTLDRGIIVETDECWWVIINDLKWGRGIPVSPVRNKQLVLYGLGFWEAHAKKICVGKPVRFQIVIDQPRCGGGGGFWETTLEELQAIGDYLRERAQASSTMENPPRVPSEKGCMFCRRKNAPGGCPPYEEWRVRLLGLRFSDLDVDVSEAPKLEVAMTPERRAYLLYHKAGIERWLDTHYDKALDDALTGLPVGKMKAVIDGRRGPRAKWKHDATAEEVLVPLLGDQSFTKKLITPTQACKAVPSEERDNLENLIERGEKGHSLVPLDDARDAVTRTSSSEFDDL
jgi:hypothetical protein